MSGEAANGSGVRVSVLVLDRARFKDCCDSGGGVGDTAGIEL